MYIFEALEVPGVVLARVVAWKVCRCDISDAFALNAYYLHNT